MELQLTNKQLDTLRHMLGINDPAKAKPEPYRDHYCARPGDPYMVELAQIGAVQLVSGPREHMPYDHYRCTDAGRAAAIASFKTIRHSKAKRVYSAFLDMSDCYEDLTFKEFLTNPLFAEARRSA